MLRNNRLCQLLFGFTSDLIAILVLPYTLVMLSLQWLTFLLLHFPWTKNYDLMPVVIFTVFTVGGGLFLYGLNGNIQRCTPRLLLRYLIRASGLTFGFETVGVILSYLVMRYYPDRHHPDYAITQGEIVFLIWVLAFLAYLWFCGILLVLPDPLPNTEDRMLRGLPLEKGDDIEYRANQDI